MEGELRDGLVYVGDDARQRFYDSRGYGRPLDGDRLALAPVEAAHLLARDDLAAVLDGPDRLGVRELLERTGSVLEFVVYRDLRERGFYLSPAREDWVADPSGADFVVYPRGEGPWGEAVAHRVRITGERESIPATDLGDVVLAVVDEDGELTYFDTDRPTVSGTRTFEPAAPVSATLLDDRAMVWDPPADLYDRGFYGQRLQGRHADSGPIQLSLVEAAHLARRGLLDGPIETVLARGREVEGERFERRLRVYAALRAAGSVPKSGFKFGADFRVYDDFESVAEMEHSDRLIRVVERGTTFFPRDLSLDVRLAGGVRKRMVFALTGANGGIDWLSVARLTP